MQQRNLLSAALALVLGTVWLATMPADSLAQRRGGTLKYMIPADGAPSLDAHREATFATIHPSAPFYSLLIFTDPTKKGGTKLAGDLAVGLPKVSRDKKTYTFTLRKGIKFHDGSPLTAKDVVASWRKLINPESYGKDVLSARKGFFSMVKSYKAQGSHKVVFKLKHPSGAFVPAVAMPYNYIYKAALLKKNPRYHEKKVMGSGAFQLVEYVPGSRVIGKRFNQYFLKGRPYLDGFEAIFAKKQNVYVQALRGGRIHGVFRGLPPAAVNDLVKARGKTVNVHESTWNCSVGIVINVEAKPFNDIRVRQALSLAFDRWAASKQLSRIALVKTVGGITFPGHPLSPNKAELQTMLGYGTNIKKARAQAKKLLRQAGQSNLQFEFINRNTDQPYKVVGTWMIDQWRRIGVKVKQKTVTSSQWFGLRRSRKYQVGTDAACQGLVNPTVDIGKFQPGASNDYSSPGLDPKFEKMHSAQLREGNFKKQRAIILNMNRYILNKVTSVPLLWWHYVLVHDKKLRGYNIAPSHYLNMGHIHLWLDK